jgi:DNA-binding response OmpR family regulator
VLRRYNNKSDRSGEQLRIGKLTVDFGTYVAEDSNGVVRMSHKEYEILKYFLKRKNETVSRHDLLVNVWGYDETPTTRTVDNFILKLRQKIEDDPNDPRIILTVHGTGYVFVDK